MKQELKQGFLEQFSNSKKSVSNWPAWMQESAAVSVAALPRSGDNNQRANTESKKAIETRTKQR